MGIFVIGKLKSVDVLHGVLFRDVHTVNTKVLYCTQH